MKILIIQLRQLGDVLLTATLARAIKENIQNSKVDFLTSSPAKEILTLNPYIDEIFTIQKDLFSEFSVIKHIRANSYDAVIDVQRTATTKRISFFSSATKKIAFKSKDNFYYNNVLIHENHSYTVDDRLTLLKPLGIKIDDGIYLPELYYDKNTDNKIENLLENLNLKNNFFVVMPTARKKIKSWPLDYFIQLIDKVYYELGYTPLVVVAPNEDLVLKEIKKQVKAKFFSFSNLSIKELACLIKKSQFFIGNDSFGGHVAVSQKKKSFILVGFSSGWFPKNRNTVLITANLDCQPCNNWKKCPYPLNNDYLKCFFSLNPTDVFKIIKSQLIV